MKKACEIGRSPPPSSHVTFILALALTLLPTVARADDPTRYTVRTGDTLFQIATKFGVSIEAITKANAISDPDSIRAGTSLVIPATMAAHTGLRTLLPTSKPIGAGLRTLLPTPTPEAALPATTEPSASAPPASRFVASISSQTCWLYRDGALAATWSCSTGSPSSPTIPGEYVVQTKLVRGYGGSWDWWLPFWLGIYSAGDLENGIHGLPYSATTGQEFWGTAIGTPVTYGCVVLDNVAAELVYDAAYVGMPVSILP